MTHVGVPSNFTRVMRAMFIDAGPTRSGWVVLETWTDYQSTIILPTSGGWSPLDQEDRWLGPTMASVWNDGGVVGIEYIDGGLYDRKRWQQLLETGRVEGEIRRIAKSRGGRAPDPMPFREMPGARRASPRILFAVPASSWRLHLMGRKDAKDQEIEVVVRHLIGRKVNLGPRLGEQHVVDVPGLDSTSKPHIYDAAGGALVLTSVMLGVQLIVPDDVRAAQERARADARQRKAIAKTCAALGVDPRRAKLANGESAVPERRKMARGQRAGKRAVSQNTRDFRRKK